MVVEVFGPRELLWGGAAFGKYELIRSHRTANPIKDAKKLRVIPVPRRIEFLFQGVRSEAVNDPFGELDVLFELLAADLGVSFRGTDPSFLRLLESLDLALLKARDALVFSVQFCLRFIVCQASLFGGGLDLFDALGRKSRVLGRGEVVLFRCDGLSSLGLCGGLGCSRVRAGSRPAFSCMRSWRRRVDRRCGRLSRRCTGCRGRGRGSCRSCGLSRASALGCCRRWVDRIRHGIRVPFVRRRLLRAPSDARIQDLGT
jgi:hypothetical protein